MSEGLNVTMYQEAPRAKYTPTGYVNYAQPGAGDITQEEFKQALTEYKDKGDVPAELKEKFNHFIESGYITYLGSREISDLYKNYLVKEASKKQGTELDAIIGAGSGFYGHIRSNHKNTTASLVLDFIESVRRDGKDKTALDPQLALKLYDAKNGFGITASDMQTMKNSSDNMVRAAYEIAVKLGLNAVIAKTRSDVINGVRSERTKDLPTQIVDGIMDERFSKNKALLPNDGSMVIGYDKNNRPIKVDGFAIDPIIEKTGGSARSPFKDQSGQTINYAKFFEGLTALQIKGDSDKERDKYVLDFLTAIFEHYDDKIINAGADQKEALRQEEKAVARNLTGRGLLSSEICAPVVAALRSSGGKKEVRERLTASKLDTLAVDLIENFKHEMSESKTAQAYDHVKSLWNKSGEKIELIDPDSFMILRKGLNDRINDADMTSDQKRDDTKITVEKAYDMYHQARRGSINKVFDGLIAKQILGSGYVSSENVNAALTLSVKALDDAKATKQDKNGIIALISDNIKTVVGKTANKDNSKDIQKAIDKFIATVTGHDASSLDKRVYDPNDDLKQARNNLALLVAGATSGTSDQEIKDSVTALVEAIIARKDTQKKPVDKAEENFEKNLQVKSRDGRDTLSALFEGFRAAAPSEEGLNSILDLTKLEGFVKANSKLKNQVLDLSNKQSFEAIETAPQEAGSLVSLIYKKTDDDSTKNDSSANMVGVLGVISKFKNKDTREEIVNALVKDIFKPDSSVSEQANTERRVQIAQTLLSIVNDDPAYPVAAGRDGSGYKVKTDDPGFYLSSSALQLSRANLDISLESYDRDKREKLGKLLDAHMVALSAAEIQHTADITQSQANILTSLASIDASVATFAPDLLKDAKAAVKAGGKPDLSKVTTKLDAVKTGVDAAKTAIDAVKTALTVGATKDSATLRTAIATAKTELGKAKIPATLLSQLETAINGVGTNRKTALAAIDTIQTTLGVATTAIDKSSKEIRTELVALTGKLSLPDNKKLTQALKAAQSHLDGVSKDFTFSNWVNERVVKTVERERFLSKAFSLMGERIDLHEGHYASGFTALYAPADEAQGNRKDQVELLKRMDEHAKADDPVKSFREAMSKAEDDDSKRILTLFENINSKSRDVHEGPDVQVLHSKTIFERMIGFIQNFIMNRDLLGTSGPRYYPDLIRKRLEAAGNDGASLASSRPAASPAKPAEAAPSLN